MAKGNQIKGIFEEPEIKKLGVEELSGLEVSGGSYGEAVVGAVASGVTSGIVTIMVPGPGIPG
ncbi:MAG: hypothetical protein K1W37_01920 [Lachnospiraceae bacterium]|jgi:hypothetical protein